jgi:RimJ/RimL family protein N-acetyltransferase
MYSSEWSMSGSTTIEPRDLAFVAALAHRGLGVARRALGAIATQLAAEGVQEVFGGAEPDNVASIRCALVIAAEVEFA